MTQESFQIIWRHLLLLVQICIGLVLLRMVLYFFGLDEYIPGVDYVVQPLILFVERVFMSIVDAVHILIGGK